MGLQFIGFTFPMITCGILDIHSGPNIFAKSPKLLSMTVEWNIYWLLHYQIDMKVPKKNKQKNTLYKLPSLD